MVKKYYIKYNISILLAKQTKYFINTNLPYI
jgi:hypothetical protein